MSSREEFDTLVSIEEKLTTALEQKCGAVLSGRISTDGRRKFYFYGSLPRTFESALAESMTEFHGYRFEYDSQEDPGWRQYLDVLYPSVVKARGYTVDSESEDVKAECPYGVRVSKRQEVNPEALEDSVIELFRASKTCHGQYDGWETELITGKPRKKPGWKLKWPN